jgi:hypothetical protein
MTSANDLCIRPQLIIYTLRRQPGTLQYGTLPLTYGTIHCSCDIFLHIWARMLLNEYFIWPSYMLKGPFQVNIFQTEADSYRSIAKDTLGTMGLDYLLTHTS